MKVLYYTVVLGSGMAAVNAACRQPVDTLRLGTNELGQVEHGGIEPYRQKCRIQEFVDIEQYDAVCALEADVSCSYPPVYGLDTITVEQGEWKKFNLGEEEHGPWNGLVWVPRSMYSFFPRWVAEYARLGRFHRHEEFTLRDSLAGFSWNYATDMGRYGESTKPITHYLGVEAKRFLVPNYTQLYAKDFNQLSLV